MWWRIARSTQNVCKMTLKNTDVNPNYHRIAHISKEVSGFFVKAILVKTKPLGQVVFCSNT